MLACRPTWRLHRDIATEGRHRDWANRKALQRCIPSFLLHWPPGNPCCRREEVSIEYHGILWSRMHGDHWEGTSSLCSTWKKLPYEKSFPSFIHRDQLVVNNTPSGLGLVLKITVEAIHSLWPSALPTCWTEKWGSRKTADVRRPQLCSRTLVKW